MILVDSSIWIEADRLPDSEEGSELDSLLREDEVAATDLVIAEVLQGAPTEEKFSELSERMDALHFFHAEWQTWQQAARLSFQLRRQGMPTPLSDLVIATVALNAGIPVYARDRHFARVPGLQMYTARI